MAAVVLLKDGQLPHGEGSCSARHPQLVRFYYAQDANYIPRQILPSPTNAPSPGPIINPVPLLTPMAHRKMISLTLRNAGYNAERVFYSRTGEFSGEYNNLN